MNDVVIFGVGVWVMIIASGFAFISLIRSDHPCEPKRYVHSEPFAIELGVEMTTCQKSSKPL